MRSNTGRALWLFGIHNYALAQNFHHMDSLTMTILGQLVRCISRRAKVGIKLRPL